MKLVDFQFKWVAKLQMLIDKLLRLPTDVVKDDVTIVSNICRDLADIETPKDFMLFLHNVLMLLRNNMVKNPEVRKTLEELISEAEKIDEHGYTIVTIQIKLIK